jgi:hypothetical protein
MKGVQCFHFYKLDAVLGFTCLQKPRKVNAWGLTLSHIDGSICVFVHAHSLLEFPVLHGVDNCYIFMSQSVDALLHHLDSGVLAVCK